jgi:hypothetical protein
MFPGNRMSSILLISFVRTIKNKIKKVLSTRGVVDCGEGEGMRCTGQLVHPWYVVKLRHISAIVPPRVRNNFAWHVQGLFGCTSRVHPAYS